MSKQNKENTQSFMNNVTIILNFTSACKSSWYGLQNCNNKH